MSIGLLFSGQGAQSVGMARSLFEASDSVKKIFSKADDVLGYSLSKLCFEGPMEELTKTSICQPALYMHGICAMTVLKEKGMLDDLKSAIGLSLGELTAHAAAETYDFETGLRVVAERARLMQEACEASKGSMASLIGGTVEQVEEYCKEFDVEIANLNCPGQIVISGESDKIKAAVEAANSRKTFKMVIALKVAGAYHSRLMSPAKEGFAKFLDTVEFKTPKIAVFTNTTGKQVSTAEEIKQALINQVVMPVRWEDCMKNAASLNISQFYECGPGAVLTGLAKRIDKELVVKSVAEIKDF